MMGIEPMTSSLPRKRSTPELHRRKVLNLLTETLLMQEIPAFAGILSERSSLLRHFDKLSKLLSLRQTFHSLKKVTFKTLNCFKNNYFFIERETGFEPATFSLEG